MTAQPIKPDIILVGSGLQTAIILAALAKLSEPPRITVIAPKDTSSMSHTWSLHKSDLSPTMQDAVKPILECSFTSQIVKFPDFQRELTEEYWVTTTSSVRRFLAQLENQGIFNWVDGFVTSISENTVSYAGGSLEASLILDNRGLATTPPLQPSGWQKFVGLELELSFPSPLKNPIIMDATVDQIDGYRFVYVLPLTPHRVLVEDTYYSDTPDLDFISLEARIMDYCHKNNISVKSVIRREHGSLPIPLTGLNPKAPCKQSKAGIVIEGGYRGDWYQRTTGYSFPIAAKLAEVITKHFTEGSLRSAVEELWQKHRVQSRTTTLLNHFLFRHFSYYDRWNSLSRFYKLPEKTIQRFYAGNLTLLDTFKIVSGRPPRGFKFIPKLRSPTCQRNLI